MNKDQPQYLTRDFIEAILRARPWYIRAWSAIWFFVIRALRLKFKCSVCKGPTRDVPFLDLFASLKSGRKKWQKAVCFNCLDAR